MHPKGAGRQNKYIDMLSCTITTNEYGIPKVVYTNGFTFEGEFGANHSPVYGTIKNAEKGEYCFMYNGQIGSGAYMPVFDFSVE